ncbi:MAG TPA: maleylpyruvate isomerase N-terminal domain-containing protein [Actinomycetota bacterium]|nr:maleylpyruvate isomerase N-terminal domain-containing protein [Actinomycetota bacterium]
MDGRKVAGADGPEGRAVAGSAEKAELCREEDRAWEEVARVLESVPPEELEEPGYLPGWSVKDLLAHLACWCSEAARAFQRMRVGTYRPRQIDVDAWNRRFYDAHRDLPPSVVRAEICAARARMLAEFNALPELSPEAVEWFRESGALHYGEHLPRLRAFVEELRARREGPGAGRTIPP